MAIGNWVVGALIRFSTNGPAVMSRLASSTQLANAALMRQNGQISANELRMTKFAARMKEIHAQQLRFVTGAATVGVGVGLFGITAAVSDAAKLQQILLSIKNETGATGAQVGQFYNTAFAIANRNGMTPVQAGDILRTISRLTAGQFTIDKMNAIAPAVANFASSIHYNRPDIGVNEAATVGLQTAHLFRAYTQQALNPLLDAEYRLSGLMAEKPEAALRQMSYYEPLFKMLGIDNRTAIADMALLDRAGFRNKVGTNVRAQILESLGPLQLTRHAQAGKMMLLERMGIFRNGRFAWNNSDGSLNLFGELQQLGTFVTQRIKAGVSRATVAKEMFGAFGKQGGTIASLFGDPQMAGILASIRRYLGDPNVGLQAASRNRELGLGFQFTRMTSNFTAVLTELGYPWLQDITRFFKSVGDNLHNAQAWLHTHRDVEKQIGAAIAGTTAILGMIAGLGAVSMASNVLRVTGAFEALSGIFGTASGWMLSIRMLAPWILSLGEAAGWIGLAVGGIMTINHLPDIAGRITQWWERNQNMISYTIGYAFGTIGHWIVAAMKNLIGVAMSAVGALLGTIGSPSEFAKLMLPGGGAFVAADVARSVSQALNSYKYIGADPGGQALRGLYGGYQGHSYQPPAALRGKYGPGAGAGVHLSIDKLEFHFGKDISPEDAGKHAGDTLSALSLHPRIALKTGGAFRTSPLLPISQTVGGMTFGK